MTSEVGGPPASVRPGILDEWEMALRSGRYLPSENKCLRLRSAEGPDLFSPDGVLADVLDPQGWIGPREWMEAGHCAYWPHKAPDSCECGPDEAYGWAMATVPDTFRNYPRAGVGEAVLNWVAVQVGLADEDGQRRFRDFVEGMEIESPEFPYAPLTMWADRVAEFRLVLVEGV